jgi:hypothetical protein
MAKIVLSDVLKKHLTIIVYLLVSGVLGWLLAVYVVNNEALAIVFAPAINYVLYSLKKELDNEGIREALK